MSNKMCRNSSLEIWGFHGGDDNDDVLQSLPHSVPIDPFLQTSLPATLYIPSDTQHRHFSPEDEDSMLLRNVGFYQPVHTVPKPRTSSSSSSTVYLFYGQLGIVLKTHY
jgi:hypothetical protein